jgi:purine-cytosine permease-like protein
VNLVDFYAVRHGRYAITEIFNPKGIYGRWSWRGLTAYSVGFLAMIPFFSLPGLFTGPVAAAIGGADISFAVGLVVAGGLYLLFARGLDRSAEEEARVRSQRELEGVESVEPA